MGSLDADARQVAAEYQVQYRLSLRGYVVSPSSSSRADILACSADGLRVALLRVRALEHGELRVSDDPIQVARNRACVCVELTDPDEQPSCYVVPSAIFSKFPTWTGNLLEPYRERWHLLGLDRARLRIAS